jgi:hypothetical protein
VLLVDRVRVAGVAVLVLGGLQEADRGQVAGLERGVEVRQVVVVVGPARVADLRDALRGQVVRVGRRLVVLERRVVRAVVLRRGAADVGVGGAGALGVAALLAVPRGARPWNQPQLTPLALSRSPMFLPCMTASALVAVWSLSEQSSKAGSGSLIIVPTPLASGETTVYGSGFEVCWGFSVPVAGSTEITPWVLPEITLTAPGLEGP